MITLEDGAYTIEVALTGGSGRADVDSPAHLTVNQGQMQAQIVWSSPYYDYMEVDWIVSALSGFDCWLYVTWKSDF